MSYQTGLSSTTPQRWPTLVINQLVTKIKNNDNLSFDKVMNSFATILTFKR